ncbi:GAF and ANTAR domain-containing protein [Micromonospora sp. NPDC005171]|uniref:GAF and ANTAR domain-containing protein n=1 Tax=Micromonospora sp. NPDC005171 TaxID=3156866 RepID=UPI0033B4A556
MDPNAAIFELGQIKLGETDLSGVLTQVSELARRTIPGAEEVSVTLIKQEGAHTAAFSGEMALRLDELQYEYGQGPCLAAARESAVVSVPNMSEEVRWPRWAARAVQGGAHSSLSIGLYDATATLAAQMQLAMQSRAVIEQAKGIIMGERRCTPDEAFAVLAKVSQDSNRKLREVAAALVERATRPPGLKRDRGGSGNPP